MRNKTRKSHGDKASPRALHAAGLVQNHGPRRARQRRELARLVANVRKVLHRSPTRLVLWVERDYRQARAQGRGFFSSERLSGAYTGTVVGIGNRALLVLHGATPL